MQISNHQKLTPPVLVRIQVPQPFLLQGDNMILPEFKCKIAAYWNTDRWAYKQSNEIDKESFKSPHLKHERKERLAENAMRILGADFVMLGSMFSGHDEGNGETIEEEGKKFKLFYGMSSDTAMRKYSGGVAEYRSSEGRTVKVPYKGPVDNTVLDILGGLRSSCTYVGAKKLKELSKRTTFVRVNNTHNRIFEK